MTVKVAKNITAFLAANEYFGQGQWLILDIGLVYVHC